jgi:hypothetical protein
MFFMCCSVQGEKGPVARLARHSKNGRGQTVDANQFRIGLLLGWVGIVKKTLQTEPLCMKLIQLKSVGPHAEKMAALLKETP